MKRHKRDQRDGKGWERPLLTLATALLAVVAIAGDGSGYNQKFLKWRKMKAAGMLPSQRKAGGGFIETALPTAKTMVGGDSTGLAPEVKSFSYLSDIVGAKNWDPVEGHPAKYDLREQGNVTAVRNQGDFNTCWAFASIASLGPIRMRRA